MEDGEEILIKTFTLDEALVATRIDHRCGTEAALALWLYAGSRSWYPISFSFSLQAKSSPWRYGLVPSVVWLTLLVPFAVW